MASQYEYGASLAHSGIFPLSRCSRPKIKPDAPNRFVFYLISLYGIQ